MNMIDLEENKNYRFVMRKDYSGKLIKMALVKEQECIGKEHDLYKVCKVEDNGVDEKKFITLYKETFTPAQVEEFYNPPVRGNRFTTADEPDDESLSLLDMMPGDFNIEDNLIEIYD